MSIDAWKITLHFSMAPLPGWSESVYAQLGGLTEPSIPSVDQLVGKRLIALVDSAQITSYTVAAQPAQRLSRHYLVDNGQGLRHLARDIAASGVDFPLISTSGRRRDFTMHGMPDDSNTFRLNGSENRAWSNVTTQYLDYLVANHYQMRVLRALSSTTPRTATIVSIVAGVVTINCPGLTIVRGQQFDLSGTQGYKVTQFRGRFVCGNYVDPLLTFSTRRSLDPTYFAVPGSTKIRVIGAVGAYSYENIANYLLSSAKGATRKVGRPSDAPRGRRSAGR